MPLFLFNMKYLILFLLSCFYHSVSAEQLPAGEMKKIGYSLANYQLCSEIALAFNDPVMSYYYEKMLLEEESNHKKLMLKQTEVISKEQVKASLILSQINRASMHQLCSSRFDNVSRQYYQTLFDNQPIE